MIGYIAFNFTLIFLLIGSVSMCFIGSVTGKYYDAKLKKHGQRLPNIPNMLGTRLCGRARLYLLLILLNNTPRLGKQYKWWPKSRIMTFQVIFGDIDYRALARKRDWLMAVLFWYSSVLCMIFFVIMCLASQFKL